MTLRSYKDDDEVDVKLGAVVANNSSGSMISGRLAKQLGVDLSEEFVEVQNPFFSSPPFNAKKSSRPVKILHDSLPDGYGLIYPIIVENLFWELIIGGSVGRQLLSAPLSRNQGARPQLGPGYDPDAFFMGHNFSYVKKSDEDEMLRVTAKFLIEFDGASRGNPGHSGGAYFLHEYAKTSYGMETIWLDSEYFGDNVTSNQAEYSALLLGLQACVDAAVEGNPMGKTSSILRNTSICICGDSQVVIKQLKGEYGVKNATLKTMHAKARGFIEQLLSLQNEVSFCWIPREENTKADRIANLIIDRELGLEEEEEEEEDDFSDEYESLARAYLINPFDPTLLTLAEIIHSYGSCMNFMLSYNLKPWNSEDVEEAVGISRAMKEVDNEEEGNSF